jgi:drug/metabolite transporter (DMT)-like permease
MKGPLLALLSAIFFALTMIFIRRAVLKVPDASLGTLISVPMAVPIFFIILAVTGQIQSVFRFSWEGYVWLSSAGILHFVIGRSLNYKLVRLVGANVGTILRRANIMVSFIILLI